MYTFAALRIVHPQFLCSIRLQLIYGLASVQFDSEHIYFRLYRTVLASELIDGILEFCGLSVYYHYAYKQLSYGYHGNYEAPEN